jgi:hypothetical protein
MGVVWIVRRVIVAAWGERESKRCALGSISFNNLIHTLKQREKGLEVSSRRRTWIGGKVTLEK